MGVTRRLRVLHSLTMSDDVAKTLEKKLSMRPEKDDLENKNILKDDHVAPALQAAQESLKKEKIAQSLATKIAHRPDAEDLENKNILKDNSVAPSIQAAK